MKQYELSPKLKIKPSNFISRRDEEHRYITENPELILVYPPQREHQVVMFWNENLDDYNQLIEDFSELLNMEKVVIELTDNKSKPANYNNKPKMVQSQHSFVNGLSWISTDLQNVSNLCHELSHGVDFQYADTQVSSGIFSQISEKIQTRLPLLFNLTFDTFQTNDVQLTYELGDDEIFARALNQHYLRTRGDNVFANPIKPQISDYLIDHLYMTNEEFRNQINEYFMSIPEIAKWGEPEIRPVMQSKFVLDEDYETLISEFNRLTELNNTFEL